MSQMFKPGDLVVCVDDIDTQGKLEHGKTYKVIKSDAYFTFLEGLRDDNKGFYSGRFELVEEKPEETTKPQLFKPGDKIRCIAGYYELTKGITYTVEDLGTGLTGNKTVKLVGVDNYWNEGRFELVQPELVQEPSSKTQFKVGDICSAFGCEGRVVNVFNDAEYPIEVKFENDTQTCWFIKGGKYQTWHKTPSLVLVSRPKKMVTKTVEKWINVYPSHNSWTYNSEAEANNSVGINRIACVKLTGEYEVEEEA